jgi:hypothetical protein
MFIACNCLFFECVFSHAVGQGTGLFHNKPRVFALHAAAEYSSILSPFDITRRGINDVLSITPLKEISPCFMFFSCLC